MAGVTWELLINDWPLMEPRGQLSQGNVIKGPWWALRPPALPLIYGCHHAGREGATSPSLVAAM